MKTLLYFEEYESPLSHELFKRDDIDFVILRTSKNLKFFSQEYLDQTSKYKVFVTDYSKDIKEEAKRFKTWCEENNISIDYFLNDSEYYLEYANLFANALGLESLTEEQTSWVRDKVSMKERFNEIGLSTVDYAPVESKEDVINFLMKHPGEEIVFKPRRGMNSIDTYRISSIEDINNLDITFKPGKYMVESFCYDHEWSIESIVQDGVVLDSYLTYIPNATIWASISNDLNCHMTVPNHPNYFKFKCKDLIQTIVSGMNLENGVMTIEVFIDEDGNVKPSELGWRLPGCQATTNHGISYGINIYDILIDIATHKKVNLTYRNPIISVGDLYLPNKEGVVTKLTPLEELLKMEGAINGQMTARLGEYQTKRRVGNDSSGWIQVASNTPEETLQRMQNIYNNFQIETEKGRRLVYVKKD